MDCLRRGRRFLGAKGFENSNIISNQYNASLLNNAPPTIPKLLGALSKRDIYLDKSRHFWNRFSLVCAAGGRDVLESCVRVSFEMKEKGKSLLQHYSLGLSSSAVFLYIEILYYTIGPKVQFFAPFRIFSELNNVSDFDPEMSSL